MQVLKKNFISSTLLTFYRRLNYFYINDSFTNKEISGYSLSFNKNRKQKLLQVNDFSILYFFKSNLNNYYNCVRIAISVKYLSTREHLRNLSPQPLKNACRFFTEHGNDDIIVSNVFSTQDKLKKCEMAKDAWLKGNIVSSLNQFTDLYEKGDECFQRSLIKIIQLLIFHSVEKNGMAVIANIIQYVKKFSVEKNEFSLMVTLWYALFTSTLYEDNCLSDALLEVSCFKKFLEPFIPYFGAAFLKNNEVGIYQRLIEAALFHKMDNAAGILLRLLFNYYYKTGYFLGCSAVYKCCFDLNIKLTKDQIYKYNALKNSDLKMKTKLIYIHHPKDIIYKF